LDAHGAAETFVGVFVAVDGCDFGQTFEIGGGLFVGWFEILAVAAPKIPLIYIHLWRRFDGRYHGA
jgi:hypothetical protein